MLAGKVNHRFFSHRCFQSSRLWTFCLGAFACISSETPLQYASIHRRHHRFCDQEGDPHSPGRKGFLYAWAFWNADRENFEIKSAFVQDWLAKNPELLLLEVYGTYAKHVLDTVILSVLMALLAPAWLPSSLQYHPFTAAYVLGNILASNLSLAFNAFSHDSASSEKPGMCQAWDMPLYEFIGGGKAYHWEHHDFPNLALYGTWYLDGSYCFFAAMARLCRAVHIFGEMLVLTTGSHRTIKGLRRAIGSEKLRRLGISCLECIGTLITKAVRTSEESFMSLSRDMVGPTGPGSCSVELISSCVPMQDIRGACGLGCRSCGVSGDSLLPSSITYPASRMALGHLFIVLLLSFAPNAAADCTADSCDVDADAAALVQLKVKGPAQDIQDLLAALCDCEDKCPPTFEKAGGIFLTGCLKQISVPDACTRLHQKWFPSAAAASPYKPVRSLCAGLRLVAAGGSRQSSEDTDLVHKQLAARAKLVQGKSLAGLDRTTTQKMCLESDCGR
ncbi:unnamed protein product [Symbiodinium sp. CCMP2592]|nr:unnamed protein product [Symbiodinium sp. CCMP2592]